MKLDKIREFRLALPLPIPGLGCGVLGLSLARKSINLGKYASTLLKALEYRGYDSTGAVFQDDRKKITLLKDVGAPSTLVKTLGIEDQAGKIFCGQVRWATFGTVSRKNAQPHEVKCKKHIYGAHNGNLTNTRELRKFLLSEGHNVVSDNDGEMLVHTIEHYFDNELEKYPDVKHLQTGIRQAAMRKAIIQAADKIIGSYAAVITDPVTEFCYAIKAGSSLYFGLGEIEDNKFGLASSDLTALLKFTKHLVNLREGEFIEFKQDRYQIYAFRTLKVKVPNQQDVIFQPGDQISKLPVYSRLRAEDTELIPPFKYFMEQEIMAEVETSGKLIKLFQGGSNTGKRMLAVMRQEAILESISSLCEKIQECNSPDMQKRYFSDFLNSAEADQIFSKVKENYEAIYNELVKENFEKKYFFSSDKNTFIELLANRFDKKRLLIAKALDSFAELKDVQEFRQSVNYFLELIHDTDQNSRNIYAIACGTSYHASLVASLFFNEIAGIDIIPVLPGNFRGQYARSLKHKDIVIGISQSGETKDLIDIFNDIDELNLDIKKIVLVNNLNSTLGQEKSDVSIPIYCGPEIAVPATKSFINQITLFYYLAIRAAQWKSARTENLNPDVISQIENRYKTIEDIPFLIKETIETTRDQIEQIAAKIYMEPSLHILATRITGVAKEGALKIRETVLNHAEGGEASEFKHGPNTILGKNTVFGIKNIKRMILNYTDCLDRMYEEAEIRQLPFNERRMISRAISTFIFKRSYPFNLSPAAEQLFKDIIADYDLFENSFRNYPLIYVTGPETRDVNLTISQINTHKIRGADSFIIAEENDVLLENARTNPHDTGYYGWGYVPLPKTGDTLLTAFSATIVLQMLALQMSIKKMEKLNRLGLSDHGVHPDVPKNVSKSITVD